MMKLLKRFEHRVLLFLLRRYCHFDMDQWELWKIRTRGGPVYISISLKPHEGIDEGVYRKL